MPGDLTPIERAAVALAERWSDGLEREAADAADASAVFASIDVEALARVLYEDAWAPLGVGVPWEALAELGPVRHKFRERAEAVKAYLLGGAS